MATEQKPHLISGILKGVLSVIVLCGVLFVALTQTQVGRDGLKTEFERQFDRQFEGQISIGQLSGNLVYDLFATDVSLLDPEGKQIASVDSVVARPSWLSLLDGSFSLRSLTLYQPDILMDRHFDEGWNIERALSPRSEAAATSGGAYSVDLPRTNIINGRLTAADAREGSFISGLATDQRLHALQVDTEGDIAWHSRSGLELDIVSFSARLPDFGQEVQSFSGQIALDTSAVVFSESHLQLTNTDVSLSGRWTYQETGPYLEATFDAPTLDFEELRAFVPQLPARHQLSASGHIEGTPSDLFLNDVYISHGQSFAQTTGQLQAMRGAISFSAIQFRTQLYPADVREVVPALGSLIEDRTGITGGIASGDVVLVRQVDEWSLQEADLQLTATTGAGHADGDLRLDLANRRGWQYELDLMADELNLGRILPEIFPSTRLTGSIEGAGTGPLESLYGNLRAELEPSSVGPYTFSAASVEAEADSGVVLGTTRLAHNSGSIVTEGQIDLRDRRDAYYLNSQLYNFDLEAFALHESLQTELFGSVAIRGTGFSEENLQTTWQAQLDSSRIAWGDRETFVHPQELEGMLATHAGMTEFELFGDALSLRFDAAAGIGSVAHLGTHWLQNASRELDTYLTDAARDSVQVVNDEPSTLVYYPRTDFQIVIEVRDGDLLRSLVPQFPSFSSDIQASVEGHISSDDVDLSGTFSSSYFHLAPLQSHSLRGTFSLSASEANRLEPTFESELTSQADSARIDNRIFLRNPSLRYTQREDSGMLRVSSASHDGSGPLLASADVRLRRNGSSLEVQEFSYESGGQEWLITESAPITFSRRHVHVPSLEIVGRSPHLTSEQYLALQGTLSSAPDDSLLVAADDLQIHPTTGFSLLGRPVDGFASGQFVLRGGLSQPQLSGRILIDNLSFDNRLLGQVELHSSYQPGSPDIEIEAVLHSVYGMGSLRLTPDSRNLIATDNALNLSGTVRLPGIAEVGRTSDPGAFDLDVDVGRAEVFIFEYIFHDLITQTSGHLAGSGHIGGTFQRPVFEANLAAVDGSFSIPEFNLTYDIDGAFHVDRDGIEFDDVLLSDRSGGRAVVGGRLEFNEYEYFSFDMVADLDEIQIINVRNSRVLPFYGTIAASGPAYLTGPLHDAYLRSPAVHTTPDSDLFIPVTDDESRTDEGFLIFADQEGHLPDLAAATQRRNVLSDRPLGERTFLDGLSMDLNIDAPSGSTVHLVFDPLLGDAMTGQGSGRIQLQRQEGEFRTYGTFNVTSGEYLFTAGELFFRRFRIEEGTIQWDGNPVDAELDITASYHTRASAAGLSNAISSARGRIPLVVQMHIQNRVSQPSVDLSLAVDRSERTLSEDYAATALETVLNQTERETEYATSVLLTNTFLLTTELEGGEEGRLTDTGNRLAFNSLSQLVGNQLNRYLNEALPNVDLLLDVQGENPQDLDVIYGIALRLLDERLIIRGEGVWTDNEQRSAEGMEGEFIVELRFSPTVSVEAFHRREGSLLAEQVLMSTTGAGVSYQTQFPTWKEFIYRLFGWEMPGSAQQENEDSTIATRE